MALIRNIFLKTKISKTLIAKNGLCKIRQKFENISKFHFLKKKIKKFKKI